MNPYLEAAVLGLVQGLTEFLPVSSSGHLVIVQQLFPAFPTPGVTFELILHLGTLCAVLWYFRAEFLALSLAVLPRAVAPGHPTQLHRSRHQNTVMLLGIATGATAVVGLLAKDALESLFDQPRIVAVMLVVTALHLIASDLRPEGETSLEQMQPWRAGILGFIQGLAIIPGISRAGSTITWGIFIGMRRADAARFSFLMSVPAILAATVLVVKDLIEAPSGSAPLLLGPYVFGAAIAGAVGYLTIALLLKMISQQRLWPFALYCAVVGVTGVLYFR